MSFALLLPAALAALAALLLPLVIHLARRSEQRPTMFAALRWLRQLPRPRRRLRLDEWPLLLLRLLLLALLALWLARPVLHGEQARTPWFVALPGVDPAQVRAAAGTQAQTRWLAPGSPDLAQPPPLEPPPFASLLRQLDAELPVDAALTVFAPERLQNADAALPVLSRPVDWRVLPGEMPAPAERERAPPALQVVHADDRAHAVRYLRAAAQAWRVDDAQAPVEFSAAPLAQAPAPGRAVLVWLAPGALPEPVLRWIEAGGVALLDAQAEYPHPPATTALWRDALGAPLVEGASLGRGRVLRWSRPLSPASMPQLLEPDFPQRLRALLGPPPAPARVAAADHAPLAGAAAHPPPPRDLQPWWALLIALVLLAERWLATSRRRGAAP